jgi:adenylate cyclase
MSYRTKLTVALLLLVVVTNGLLGFASYRRSNALLEIEIHRKFRSIAESAAVLLNPADVQVLRAPAAESRPEYGRLREQLQRVRNANRREDAWVDSIFILVPAPENPKVVEYGLDSEERFEYTHRAGDVYRRSGQPVTIGIEGINELAKRLKDFQAGYITAFAPIQDGSGRLIAELAVAGQPAASSTLSQIGPEILEAFGATIVLALTIAVVMSRSVTRPLYRLRNAIEAIGKGDLNVATPSGLGAEFAQMAAAIGAMAAGLRERDTIKRAFSGYISRQVMDAIMAQGGMHALKGERRRITVLFADIRGFTAMSEGMRPEEVVELLGEFFGRMVEVILRNKGTIDKFLGDGMMVIFGAPLDDSYQEEHAVTAAVEMQRELVELCAKWQTEGRPPIRMGIGINSGSAIVGDIGSTERMEYTAIGDTVNLASRLETATKELGVDIVVSEHTYDAVRSVFKWKDTGAVQVRGRTDAVQTYSVDDRGGNSASIKVGAERPIS